MTPLDTSGIIHSHRSNSSEPRVLVTRWRDLDPFTQGYVEALFGSLPVEANAPALRYPEPLGGWRTVHFSDLAPETLARIIEDCTTAVQISNVYRATTAGGRAFWADRQSDIMRRFQPLTLILSDDGKVIFA